MRDINYLWQSTNGSDGSTGFDGTKQYDGAASASVFWIDFLGIPLEWYAPKIDWTSADYYNFYDLNAVEANSETIAELLSEYHVQPISIVTVNDRTMLHFEFYDSMNRIEGNIGYLASMFFEPNGWEKPKTTWASGRAGGGFSFRDANRLERNLYLIYNLIFRAMESVKYIGTFYAGEDGDIY